MTKWSPETSGPALTKLHVVLKSVHRVESLHYGHGSLTKMAMMIIYDIGKIMVKHHHQEWGWILLLSIGAEGLPILLKWWSKAEIGL